VTTRFRVLLVDDHTLVRTGIRLLLQDLDGVEVIAEAGDGREALSLAEQLCPNLVVTDIAMKGLNGLEAARRIKQQTPNTHVIFLSMHAGEEYVLRALEVGASGYLLKNSAVQELELALQAIASGDTYLSPPVSKQVIAHYLREVSSRPRPEEALTDRQREILQLIAEGHTSKEIARVLAVSVKTVETHRAQIMERLNIHDIAGLVRYAIREGLVTSEG
jgi:DNA-binding NarL/FixJ family response regulator